MSPLEIAAIWFYALLCGISVGAIGYFVWGLRQAARDADDYDGAADSTDPHDGIGA